MAKPFWKYPGLGELRDFGFDWVESALCKKALLEGKTVSRSWSNGSLREDVKIDALIAQLAKYELARELTVAYHFYPSTGNAEEWILIGDDTAINVDYAPRSREISVHITSLHTEAVEIVRSVCKESIVRRVTRGRVYVVVTGEKGPYLHEIGTAGEDYIPGNYRPEVAKEYAHVVEDMNSKTPCGRIVILDGPPGTGKTHMVRALLNEVKDATFVLVPSNMMSGLGSPNFVKALLEEQRQGHPMILIVEDADECLASRKTDNLSEISALLNFSDGIFGAVLDVRIVATTNVDVGDLDPAVMRPGRLCRRVEVGKLNAVQARAVYVRLTEKNDGEAMFPDLGCFYTLGEVYQAARGTEGAYSPRKPKARLGFAPAPPDAEESPDMTPAEEMGLKPGDTFTTDEGDKVVVREDGQLEMAEGFRKFLKEMDEEDLIDEDPEDDD